MDSSADSAAGMAWGGQSLSPSWCPDCKSHWIALYSNHGFLERVLTVLIIAKKKGYTSLVRCTNRCTRCDLEYFKFRGIVHSR